MLGSQGCLISHRNQKTYAPVNLDRIQHWIDTGRLTSSPDKPITARDLLLSGCIHQVHDGIKLLGSVSTDLFFTSCTLNAKTFQGAQHLASAIHITPSRASQSAIHAVEKKGGSVFCKYYNELALRDCVKDNTERTQAAPTRKNDICT